MPGHSIKRFYDYFLSGATICFLILLYAGKAWALTDAEIQALSGEMNRKFNGYGSFEAQYKLKSGEKEGVLLLMHDAKEHYMIIKPLEGIALEAIPTFLFEYGEEKLSITVIVANSPQAVRVDLRDILLNMAEYTPLQSYLEVLSEMNLIHEMSETYRNSIANASYPVIALGLDSKNLNVGMGLAENQTSHGWLSPGFLEEAENIERREGLVIAHFGENHTVTIGGDNGFLIEDAWGEPGERPTRFLRLVALDKQQGGTSNLKYAPELEDAEIIEDPRALGIDLTRFYSDIVLSVFKSAGDIEDGFEKHKDEFIEGVRQKAIEQWTPRVNVDILDKILTDAYRNYESENKLGITFKEYIQALMDNGIADVLAEKFMKSMRLYVDGKNLESFFGENPEQFGEDYMKLRKIVLMINDTGTDAYFQGLRQVTGEVVWKFLDERHPEVLERLNT